MPGASFDSDSDFEPQDQAEDLDETVTDEDELRGEMRTFEELPELLDLTQAEGDRDDDEALALDSDEFDVDAMSDADLEEDHELNYRAATGEREDDLDGLGRKDEVGEARIAASDIDGLTEVRDADEAEGGEDDVADFQARGLSDDDLEDMGYSEVRRGVVRAKPDR